MMVSHGQIEIWTRHLSTGSRTRVHTRKRNELVSESLPFDVEEEEGKRKRRSGVGRGGVEEGDIHALWSLRERRVHARKRNELVSESLTLGVDTGGRGGEEEEEEEEEAEGRRKRKRSGGAGRGTED
ncbi:hypothetical protein CBR_g34155 [Chara braunii]|uniref:Uncharacterized protein n=1 Tax=Chara braunii TaxID=69332 RepID=A0A388LI27_CHABU|nr:hypothetical protein CBR_g34155 [Chara braunii]|eukprot:GBG81976.1 hypothetical protein CBR_g34155 [Chara braunii]